MGSVEQELETSALEVLIEAKDLSFWANKVEILTQLNFNLLAGQNLLVVGPNGAGKSTLLKLMSGFYAPSSGYIKLQGIAPAMLSPLVRAAKVVMVPQRVESLPDFTVHDLFELSLTFDSNRSNSEATQAISLWMESVGIKESAGQKLQTLSGGELQRAIIGSALVNNPAVLILDEPLTHLDPKGRQEVLDLICLLKNKGKSIVAVSHEFRDFSEICDKTLALQAGSVWEFSDTQSFKAEGRWSELFGIRREQQ